MDTERVPISDVIPDVAIHPLADGWTPLETFLLVKCLDNDGDATWSFRTSVRMNRQELLGALTVQMELLKKEFMEEWEVDDD
jgi:hypothetical protein